jgi:hypothetical protein
MPWPRRFLPPWTVDEANAACFIDKAIALEHYSQQAKNTEAERQACEIRLRAERKAGKLLSGAPRAALPAPVAAIKKVTRSYFL